MTLRSAALPLASALAITACGGSSAADGEPAPQPEPVVAPWSQAALSARAVDDVLHEQWRTAENREWCALLAPLEVERAARPRAAQFGGGWGVAWDTPDQRSAFGVAGTGVRPGPDTYDDWPHRMTWADGSTAGYGPEGGSGPRQLAYLEIPGQECLYNVWSMRGVDHLESLIDRLRIVEGTL